MAKKILSLIAITPVAEVRSKPTAKCLEGHPFGARDARLDVWFPAMQPPASGYLTTLEVQESTTLHECARLVLRLAKDASHETVDKIIRERHHFVTLPWLENLVVEAETLPGVHLHRDGHGNILFHKARCGGSLFTRTHRVDRRTWTFHHTWLKDDNIRLGRGRRLHFANLDPVPLGL